jgi:hypothetical protein
MARLFGSIKTAMVILALAAMPAASFAQATGGATGSGGGAAGSVGGPAGSTGGVANSPAPPPGTNSLGTAQSSGPNAAPGVTTGTAGSSGAADATVNTENEKLDRKMKSICRGC